MPENTAEKSAVSLPIYAIEETLYLSSIPGMAELIVEGMGSPLSDRIAEDDSEW